MKADSARRMTTLPTYMDKDDHEDTHEDTHEETKRLTMIDAHKEKENLQHLPADRV